MEPDLYDYPNVNDYATFYPIKNVRNAIGKNLRNFKFSEPNPEIIIDDKFDATQPQIYISYPKKDILLHINLKNFSSTVTQSLPIVNNVPNTILMNINFFTVTEKMSEDQFNYSINAIKNKKNTPEDVKTIEALNSSMTKLKEQLKKHYLPLEVDDNEITIPNSNGSKYIVNLSNKTVVEAKQTLTKMDKNISETTKYINVTNSLIFEGICQTLKKELDPQTLNKFLNIERKLKANVKCNNRRENNQFFGLLDKIVHRTKNLVKSK